MAEQPETSESDETPGELRGKLITRLAMAGLLVALLLGVLAFFDHLSSQPDDSDEQVFTRPVPVAPKKEVSQPVKPSENLPEPPLAEKAEPVAEPPPPPRLEVQPSPVMEAKPEPRMETRPATSKAAPVQPQTSASAATVQPVPEATMAPSNVLPVQKPAPVVASEPVAARPATKVLEPKPASSPSMPVAPRLFSGFLLQAGVFSSAQRAEELHARLTLSGVPSTLETRVQVGPFRTRQEAESAQAKLKELGVETILVPPKGKN